jgi:hypothetical protein
MATPQPRRTGTTSALALLASRLEQTSFSSLREQTQKCPKPPSFGHFCVCSRGKDGTALG